MDETEKYQQRLEAIAEKRRLQEEQDRARRDAEDEKLRQQQLKRKSLRDQWLMDKAPSSPTSPEAPSPRSPLWGPEAHEIEERIDRLQSESQRLAEEKEVHSEQTEDGQTEAVKEAEPEAEMVHCAVVQNGEHNGSDEVKTKPTQLVETGPLVNNSEASDDSRASTSGDVGDNMSELALSLGVFEAEPGQAPSVNFNPEGEGILVMRAERVIITDEGDEDLAHQKDTEEAGPEGVEAAEAAEAAEGEAETELAPETFTEPEKSEALELAAEEQSAPGDSQAGVATDERCDGEKKPDAQDKDSQGPAAARAQSPGGALEGVAAASVPLYSQAQRRALAPELEAGGRAATSPEGAEATPKAPHGQFQEVPLVDPQDSRRTEVAPRERDALLGRAKSSDTRPEPAAASGSAETHGSARAGKAAEAPKHKSCQCCAVM